MTVAAVIVRNCWTFSSLALAFLLPDPVAAEEVCIKYHKCIPLDQFACTSVTNSDAVHRFCYVESKRYMVIWLGDAQRAYHYCNIGPEIAAALREAPSRGRYYNQNIRAGRFDCRNHPIPEF